MPSCGTGCTHGLRGHGDRRNHLLGGRVDDVDDLVRLGDELAIDDVAKGLLKRGDFSRNASHGVMWGVGGR